MDREEAIVWAWRNLLDTDKNGQLSNRELTVALKSIGFKGSIKKAFAEMEESGDQRAEMEQRDDQREQRSAERVDRIAQLREEADENRTRRELQDGPH